jgi:8-oxo-dGTP diphosphatase
MNKLIIVVAVALIKNKKVLFQERPSEKSMPFLWELPGGKIKIGETPEMALIREVNEELGISINPVDLRSLTFISHSYKDFNLLMPVYLCKKWIGNIFPRENQKFKFFNKNELKKINILEADLPLIDDLEVHIR